MVEDVFGKLEKLKLGKFLKIFYNISIAFAELI